MCYLQFIEQTQLLARSISAAIMKASAMYQPVSANKHNTSRRFSTADEFSTNARRPPLTTNKARSTSAGDLLNQQPTVDYSSALHSYVDDASAEHSTDNHNLNHDSTTLHNHNVSINSPVATRSSSIEISHTPSQSQSGVRLNDIAIDTNSNNVLRPKLNIPRRTSERDRIKRTSSSAARALLASPPSPSTHDLLSPKSPRSPTRTGASRFQSDIELFSRSLINEHDLCALQHFRLCHTAHPNKITWIEFVTAHALENPKELVPSYILQHLSLQFKQLDSNRTGMITREQFHKQYPNAKWSFKPYTASNIDISTPTVTYDVFMEHGISMYVGHQYQIKHNTLNVNVKDQDNSVSRAVLKQQQNEKQYAILFSNLPSNPPQQSIPSTQLQPALDPLVQQLTTAINSGIYTSDIIVDDKSKLQPQQVEQLITTHFHCRRASTSRNSTPRPVHHVSYSTTNLLSPHDLQQPKQRRSTSEQVNSSIPDVVVSDASHASESVTRVCEVFDQHLDNLKQHHIKFQSPAQLVEALQLLSCNSDVSDIQTSVMQLQMPPAVSAYIVSQSSDINQQSDNPKLSTAYCIDYDVKDDDNDALWINTADDALNIPSSNTPVTSPVGRYNNIQQLSDAINKQHILQNEQLVTPSTLESTFNELPAYVRPNINRIDSIHLSNFGSNPLLRFSTAKQLILTLSVLSKDMNENEVESYLLSQPSIFTPAISNYIRQRYYEKRRRRHTASKRSSGGKIAGIVASFDRLAHQTSDGNSSNSSGAADATASKSKLVNLRGLTQAINLCQLFEHDSYHTADDVEKHVNTIQLNLAETNLEHLPAMEIRRIKFDSTLHLLSSLKALCTHMSEHELAQLVHGLSHSAIAYIIEQSINADQLTATTVDALIAAAVKHSAFNFSAVDGTSIINLRSVREDMEDNIPSESPISSQRNKLVDSGAITIDSLSEQINHSQLLSSTAPEEDVAQLIVDIPITDLQRLDISELDDMTAAKLTFPTVKHLLTALQILSYDQVLSNDELEVEFGPCNENEWNHEHRHKAVQYIHNRLVQHQEQEMTVMDFDVIDTSVYHNNVNAEPVTVSRLTAALRTSALLNNNTDYNDEMIAELVTEIPIDMNKLELTQLDDMRAANVTFQSPRQVLTALQLMVAGKQMTINEIEFELGDEQQWSSSMDQRQRAARYISDRIIQHTQPFSDQEIMISVDESNEFNNAQVSMHKQSQSQQIQPSYIQHELNHSSLEDDIASTQATVNKLTTSLKRCKFLTSKQQPVTEQLVSKLIAEIPINDMQVLDLNVLDAMIDHDITFASPSHLLRALQIVSNNDKPGDDMIDELVNEYYITDCDSVVIEHLTRSLTTFINATQSTRQSFKRPQSAVVEPLEFNILTETDDQLNNLHSDETVLVDSLLQSINENHRLIIDEEITTQDITTFLNSPNKRRKSSVPALHNISASIQTQLRGMEQVPDTAERHSRLDGMAEHISRMKQRGLHFQSKRQFVQALDMLIIQAPEDAVNSTTGQDLTPLPVDAMQYVLGYCNVEHEHKAAQIDVINQSHHKKLSLPIIHQANVEAFLPLTPSHQALAPELAVLNGTSNPTSQPTSQSVSPSKQYHQLPQSSRYVSIIHNEITNTPSPSAVNSPMSSQHNNHHGPPPLPSYNKLTHQRTFSNSSRAVSPPPLPLQTESELIHHNENSAITEELHTNDEVKRNEYDNNDKIYVNSSQIKTPRGTRIDVTMFDQLLQELQSSGLVRDGSEQEIQSQRDRLFHTYLQLDIARSIQKIQQMSDKGTKLQFSSLEDALKALLLSNQFGSTNEVNNDNNINTTHSRGNSDNIPIHHNITNSVSSHHQYNTNNIFNSSDDNRHDISSINNNRHNHTNSTSTRLLNSRNNNNISIDTLSGKRPPMVIHHVSMDGLPRAPHTPKQAQSCCVIM